MKVARLILVSLPPIGLITSAFFELVLSVPPCATCIYIRYLYALSIPLALVHTKRRFTLYLLLILALGIIGLSAWGVIGVYRILSIDPCIDACPLGSTLEAGEVLYPLSLLGGIALLVASLRILLENRVK